MKVGGAEYVRKKSLEAINAVAGFTRSIQPYEKPKLKFKRMCKYVQQFGLFLIQIFQSKINYLKAKLVFSVITKTNINNA